MSYSYFVADLRCSSCRETQTVNIITKIDADPGEVHRVGDLVDVTMADLTLTHHAARVPGPGEPIRILETWNCPNCRHPEWAEILIEEGRVRSIEPVPFDRATLDRVHFVTGMLAEFYEDTTGESLYDGAAVRLDWPARLRPYLDAP
jgi:hypothetical protein